MNDYYSTLGVSRNASDDEIKKAYRKLAMKHHPDRGGDQKKFAEIQSAYDVLSDPSKKEMYDLGGDPNDNSGRGGAQYHDFGFNSANFNDIFSQFGFGFNPRSPQRRNTSLQITVGLTLEDVLNGKDLEAEVAMPGGNRKFINITIPKGVEHGQQIRYAGMGDNSLKGVAPGDLIVNVQIKPHAIFKRESTNIIIDKKITIWEAMLGSSVEIPTLTDKKLNMKIPAGIQPETILSCSGEGLPHLRSGRRGNLLIKIKIDIPKNLNEQQIKLINDIKNEF